MLYDISPAPELRVQTRMRSSTMWRFAEVLPVEDWDEVISIGEGSTPMLQSRVRPNLYIKDESKNPTRSFKSRGKLRVFHLLVQISIEICLFHFTLFFQSAMRSRAVRKS